MADAARDKQSGGIFEEKGHRRHLDTVLTALPKIIRIQKDQTNSHQKIVYNKASIVSYPFKC